VHHSINDENGYPCPKDGTLLALLDGGAWCPQCHTLWREIGEVDLADLDALPEAER
jgi:hypothetical protein